MLGRGMCSRVNHTLRVAAIVAAAGLALLASACGSSGKVAGASSSSAGGVFKAAGEGTSADQAQLEDEYLRFARCMRSHGVSDFPDPIIGSGGHPGFSLQGGSNSDSNSNNSAFQRAARTCQHFLGHEFRFVFTPSGAGKGA
jgi:hypothetical protein